MLTKIFKFMFSRAGAKQIEKLAKTDPAVKQSLLDLHKAASEMQTAIDRAKELNQKYK